jgi:hypothetical protein
VPRGYSGAFEVLAGARTMSLRTTATATAITATVWADFLSMTRCRMVAQYTGFQMILAKEYKEWAEYSRRRLRSRRGRAGAGAGARFKDGRE